jgi:hypothetical protein
MENSQNYWVSCPIPHPTLYPKWMYHATEPPRQVRSPDEENGLGEGWSPIYIKKDYPKMKFRPIEGEPKPGGPKFEFRVVNTPEDEGKLEGSWSDSPPEREDPQTSLGEDRTLEQLAQDAKDKRRAALDYRELDKAMEHQIDSTPMRPVSSSAPVQPEYQAPPEPKKRKGE